MKMHAKDANVAWQIARQETEMYQRRMHAAKTPWDRALCKAARDAADRIALRIRFGRRHVRPPKG